MPPTSTFERAPADEKPIPAATAATTPTVSTVGTDSARMSMSPLTAVTAAPLMYAATWSSTWLSASDSPNASAATPPDSATATLMADRSAWSTAVTLTPSAERTVPPSMKALTSLKMWLLDSTPAPLAARPRPPAMATAAAAAAESMRAVSSAWTVIAPLRERTDAPVIDASTLLPISLCAIVTPTATATAAGPKPAATATAAATEWMLEASSAARLTLAASMPPAALPSIVLATSTSIVLRAETPAPAPAIPKPPAPSATDPATTIACTPWSACAVSRRSRAACTPASTIDVATRLPASDAPIVFSATATPTDAAMPADAPVPMPTATATTIDEISAVLTASSVTSRALTSVACCTTASVRLSIWLNATAPAPATATPRPSPLMPNPTDAAAETALIVVVVTFSAPVDGFSARSNDWPSGASTVQRWPSTSATILSLSTSSQREGTV